MNKTNIWRHNVVLSSESHNEAPFKKNRKWTAFSVFVQFVCKTESSHIKLKNGGFKL